MKRSPVHKVKDYVSGKSIEVSEKTIEQTGALSIFFSAVADFFLFVSRTVKETFSRSFEFREFLNQCFQIGNKSLGLVSITAFIIGMVFTIQTRPTLLDFGAVSLLPGMVTISIIREIGPVITALICAGKVGSGMGAELGSMKVSEQIDAMEVSSTNPMNFLVVTRVLAATLMVPLLILYADAISIFGSWMGANIKGDVSLILFFSQAFNSLELLDFLPAFIKSFFFGAVIGLVGCFKGYMAGRGTESVGTAANSAVVISSLLIIIVDMIAVQITDMMI
jgi:phospholipid/cholesterol/gamma-HCH transport system permease protein